MVRLSTKKIALIAVYAAILGVVSRLPGIPILVGVKAGSIELTVPLYPIVGILFGPYVGALAALIGNIVIFLIPKWSIFGLLTIPAGALSALVAGFLTRRDKFLDWKAAALVLGALIFCWYIPFPNPLQAYVGLEAPFYPVPLHVPALALVLISRHKISDFINSSRRRVMALGVALASYA
ncbi:MAG: ECF transporter S component, partial [Candidatus Bathyarchaeia archaeon]